MTKKRGEKLRVQLWKCAHVDWEELVVAVYDSLLVVDKVKVGLLETLLCKIRAEGTQAIGITSSVFVCESTAHTIRKGKTLGQENREG